MVLKTPEGFTGATEAGLDFVGDAKTTCGADMAVGFGEVAIGINHGSAHPLDRLGDEASDFSWRGEADQIFDVGGVIFSSLGIGGRPKSTVGIG